jgi:hypothetical protein
MQLEDGTGNGYYARIDANNRIHTEASTRSAQAEASYDNGAAFQVLSGDVNVTTGDQEILYIKNSSKKTKLVITYIRLQTVGVAARDAAAYWSKYINPVYASGGAAVTAVNMNSGSGVQPTDISFYSGTTPIVASGGSLFEKNFDASQMSTYNKEGALIVAPGGELSINFIGSTGAGVAHVRVSFYLRENGD